MLSVKDRVVYVTDRRTWTWLQALVRAPCAAAHRALEPVSMSRTHSAARRPLPHSAFTDKPNMQITVAVSRQ